MSLRTPGKLAGTYSGYNNKIGSKPEVRATKLQSCQLVNHGCGNKQYEAIHIYYYLALFLVDFIPM